MSSSNLTASDDIDRVIEALGAALKSSLSIPASESAAAVIAADSLALAMCCEVRELQKASGAAQVAVANITQAILGRGIAGGDLGERCPRFNAAYADFALRAAEKVSSWGLEVSEVLPLAAQLLYSAPALQAAAEIAALLEAEAQ